MDAQDSIHDCSREACGAHPVGDGGGDGAEAIECADFAHDFCCEWGAVFAIVLCCVFGFEAGDVDVAGALGFAGFAGEAEVEGFFCAGVVPDGSGSRR